MGEPARPAHDDGPEDPHAAGGAVQTVRAAAHAAGLADEEGVLVAMVSGGRDSVCLLDVAVALRESAGVRALHVNYGLRPGADAAEALVARLCQRLGVPLDVHHATRPEHRAGNLQAWARDARYGVATRLALSCGGVVATGHTATDQVETVLYRLASSPGRRALLGMTPRDGLLRRPLLSVSREQTAAYCRARDLAYDDDESNDGDRFARGRVRHGLVPALREVHPAAERNVLRTAALLREEATVLDGLVEEVLAGRPAIEVPRLAALPPGLARLVVVRLAEDARGQLVPAAGRRLDELLRLGARGGSASLDLGGGVRAIVEYGILRMSAEAEQPVPAPVALAVPGRVRFGRWELCCELDPEGDADRADVTAVVDADAAVGPLLVRPWRRGDRMAPIGAGGSKTLADLFTDRRLPRARRRTIPVVECGGQVAWVPGIATDQRFRVGAGTSRMLRLRAYGPGPD
jgi:tRNA(Ile)-lysidine synthase